jgi:hypothetical protein
MVKWMWMWIRIRIINGRQPGCLLCSVDIHGIMGVSGARNKLLVGG